MIRKWEVTQRWDGKEAVKALPVWLPQWVSIHWVLREMVWNAPPEGPPKVAGSWRSCPPGSIHPWVRLLPEVWVPCQLRMLESKNSGRPSPGLAVRSCQKEGWVKSEHEWDIDRVCGSLELHYLYLMIYYVYVYIVCVFMYTYIKHMYRHISGYVSVCMSGRKQNNVSNGYPCTYTTAFINWCHKHLWGTDYVLAGILGMGIYWDQAKRGLELHRAYIRVQRDRNTHINTFFWITAIKKTERPGEVSKWEWSSCSRWDVAGEEPGGWRRKGWRPPGRGNSPCDGPTPARSLLSLYFYICEFSAMLTYC